MGRTAAKMLSSATQVVALFPKAFYILRDFFSCDLERNILAKGWSFRSAGFAVIENGRRPNQSRTCADTIAADRTAVTPLLVPIP